MKMAVTSDGDAAGCGAEGGDNPVFEEVQTAGNASFGDEAFEVNNSVTEYNVPLLNCTASTYM